MMNLQLDRLIGSDKATLGLMWRDGKSECMTLEDEHRDVKVKGETRIPAGTYQIIPRLEGGMIQRYKKRFAWHKGMLWLQDVPNFQFVYIHVGNFETDTDGCILVGRTADRSKMTLQSSVPAYQKVYPAVYPAAEAGLLQITIRDLDR